MTMMILIEQGKLQALLHPVLEQVLLFLLVEQNLIEAEMLMKQFKLQALLHPVLEQVLLFLLAVRNLMEAE
jgi:hypothetical protein